MTTTPSTPTGPGEPVSILAHAPRAAALLRGGADRIERCGLFQGQYWPAAEQRGVYIDGDPCCALGALAVAANIIHPHRVDDELAYQPELVLAVDSLTDHLDPHQVEHTPVAGWNDHPRRTASEVTTALRAAAAALEPICYRLREQPTDPPPAPPGDGPSDRCALRPGGPSATSFHRAGASSTHQHDTSEVSGNV